MISNQETLNLSPDMAIYDIVVPKDNMLRQINELVDFSFILEELKTKYCLDNGRNAIPPIRMFKYLLLKAIYDVSDVDLVERINVNTNMYIFARLRKAAVKTIEKEQPRMEAALFSV
ncbi:transposase [Lysinibacillus sp. CNPSo 3705]|uniref:transposase n=1 Tax=Lysinibacillus sp. CNPSo 3705 TaxID=3028148 RepID=UPI00236477C3|nr:transposase [Lysinibacillus sp. CNPSo 3705]MDD1505915.1 transposase [Lysinibacillus sp. CNPSo 3705]